MSCFDLQKLAFLSRYFTRDCNAFHHFAPRPRSMTNNIRVTLAANQIRSKPNTNCKLVMFPRPLGSLPIPFPIICPSRCSMVIGYLKLFWNSNKYSERRFFSSNFLKLPQGVELACLKGWGGGRGVDGPMLGDLGQWLAPKV